MVSDHGRVLKSGVIPLPGSNRSHRAIRSASRNISEHPAHSKNSVA
jgi:hypothetical protein